MVWALPGRAAPATTRAQAVQRAGADRRQHPPNVKATKYQEHSLVSLAATLLWAMMAMIMPAGRRRQTQAGALLEDGEAGSKAATQLAASCHTSG